MGMGRPRGIQHGLREHYWLWRECAKEQWMEVVGFGGQRSTDNDDNTGRALTETCD